MAPAETTSLEATPTRRALLAAAMASWATPLLAAPGPAANRPKVLAGLMLGVNEPGSDIATRALDLLSPAAGDVSWMPWARAYMTAASGGSMIFPLARTPEREKAWQWLAPLAQDHFVLVVSGEAARRGRDLASLRQLKTGAIRSEFVVGRLQTLGFQQVDVAPTETANAKKLALGRIEAWATVASVAAALKQREGLPAGVQVVPLEPGAFSMWLAASPDVDTTALVNGARLARLRDKPPPNAFRANI